MSPSVPVGEPTGRRPHAFRVAAWSLAAICVAFLVPWVTFFVEPNGSSPWWTTWAPLGAWLLPAAVGVAWVIAGGRFRRIGAALILGDAIGFALFWITIPVIAASG